MKLLTKSVKNSHFIIFALITLVLQNIAIFFNHYFNRFGFRWDFDKSYFVTTAFWTTAVDLGISPQWIQFQSMGYPLFMKASTAFHYPMYWIFPLFSIQYTLQAAVIFQIIHILFGSIGMFFFLHHLFKSPKYAIIGAIAFQFFGGFFANSPNVDIVRGFSFLPWLFFVLTLNVDKPAISKKTLFIPIVIFLIATSAYPGIFIATIFIMTLFVVLQTLNAFSKGVGKIKSLKIGGSLFGLLLLGIVLSTVHLGPFINFGEEVTRFTDRSELLYSNFIIEQFPGFFMSSTPIPGEPTMNSTFLTLPILILASFITWTYIKKYWIFFVIFVIGILMAIGNQTPFWTLITSLIPNLDLSRFVISDYRIFIAIPLMVFAISALKSIIERQITLKSFIFRIPFILSWFSLGIILLQKNIGGAFIVDFEGLNQQINFAILILTITIFILAIYLIKLKGFPLKNKQIEISTIILIIFTSIIVVDGFRVISDMYTWHKEPFDQRYVQGGVPLEKNGNLATYSIFENIPETRPERQITKHLSVFSWKGVLTGDYMMQDSGKHVALKSRTIVESNDIYTNYMLMKWTPIFLDPSVSTENNQIILDDKIFSGIIPNNENLVVQTRYGINEITYSVSLEEPRLMVENESYFPGWTATLIYPDKEVKLEAIEVNDVFRAWTLPAGDYEMKANFQFPNLVTYQVISLSAFIIWIIVLAVYVQRMRTLKVENYIDYVRRTRKKM